MLAHFVYDGLTLVAAYFYPVVLNDDKAGDVPNIVLYALISLTAVAALVTWMVKKSRSTIPIVYADDIKPVPDNPFSF